MLHFLMDTFLRVITKVTVGTVVNILAVGNDVDFTFDFDKIYSFSKFV